MYKERWLVEVIDDKTGDIVESEIFTDMDSAQQGQQDWEREFQDDSVTVEMPRRVFSHEH